MLSLLNYMEKSKEIVSKLVSKYVREKPSRITLRLDWDDKKSSLRIEGDNLDHLVEYAGAIDFTSFSQGVLDAYRKEYGELKVVPISFREEIYENDEVSLDLHPTGSAGIFDIFIKYKLK
jgi:Rps23 Pro-64 3,4-dihydroxylase Tpa1-like proline 4-hydroxylase